MNTLRWGMLLLRYMRDRLFHIVLVLACPAVFALICALTGAPLAGVVYAGVLVLAGEIEEGQGAAAARPAAAVLRKDAEVGEEALALLAGVYHGEGEADIAPAPLEEEEAAAAVLPGAQAQHVGEIFTLALEVRGVIRQRKDVPPAVLKQAGAEALRLRSRQGFADSYSVFHFSFLQNSLGGSVGAAPPCALFLHEKPLLPFRTGLAAFADIITRRRGSRQRRSCGSWQSASTSRAISRLLSGQPSPSHSRSSPTTPLTKNT